MFEENGHNFWQGVQYAIFANENCIVILYAIYEHEILWYLIKKLSTKYIE